MMQDRLGDNPQKSANCDQNVAQPAVLRLHKPVVLVGMMGAGKSLLGAMLGQRLGLPFTDSDAVIEASEGCRISQYFERHGEPAFRECEYRTFDHLLDGTPKIIGAGGGAVVNPRTREILKSRAYPVWLQADVSELARRCAASDARPLLKTGDPESILAALLEKRTPLYAETAAFTVRTDARTIDDTLDDILAGLAACAAKDGHIKA